MKKPNFIEIRLPGRKSTFSAARRKYFKRLVGKIIEINFAKERDRKLFEYKVVDSDYNERYCWPRNKSIGFWYIKLELKVPKDDHEKVL